jgi:hypothetical protein
MIAISFTLGLRQLPATTTAWHLCTVIIPRRTITGRLVRGRVWRRHDGRRWLYKKFIAQELAPRTPASEVHPGSLRGKMRST